MNSYFLKKAKVLTPKLNHTFIEHPDRELIMKPGDEHLYDFGNHYTGYVTLKLDCTNPADAPAFLKLTFAEDKEELGFNSADYNGWLSRSWIQEETVHFDLMPKSYRLPRRYAFRYLKVEVISTSPAYDLKIRSVKLDAVSSARVEPEIVGKSARVRRIDQVGLRTLHECMQEEFEDGPKRDRRLWLGDLRLQAQVNYLTYKQNDLVKRCLYLFAALADKNGLVPGCLFTKPRHVAGNVMYDYPLLFIPTLLDYYEATGDKETTLELFPVAKRQEQIGRGLIADDGTITPTEWCFIDWCDDFKRDACALAVYIYSADALVRLGELLGEEQSEVRELVSREREVANKLYYSTEKGLFLDTGKEGVSYATNTWMTLARVADKQTLAKALKNTANYKGAVTPVTPYMYHHYIEALCSVDLTEEAYALMEGYFGTMVDMGADTYRELFDPKNPFGSPYGSPIVNSYCHAWSCAPSYFLRKYFTDK